MTFGQNAIDRHLLARLDAQHVPRHDRVDRRIALVAARQDAVRDLRREIEQRTDGAGGALARVQLKHLAEQHQHGDDGGRLEINRDRAVGTAKRVGKLLRYHGRQRAVGPGHARAHRDQREHVEVARFQRLVGAREERPAGPPHHGRSEHELNPIRHHGPDEVQAQKMLAHIEQHDRNGERRRDPKPARHVGQLGIGRAVGGHHVRLERHAADRTASRSDLADLRMHRTGVDRAFRGRCRHGRLAAQAFVRIGGELGSASGAAEEVRLALVGVAVWRGLRIDRHAADRIDHAAGGRIAGGMGLFRHGRARS